MIGSLGVQPGLSRPQRALMNAAVEVNAYIRVHVHPKRFPAAYTVDWKVCHPPLYACSFGDVRGGGHHC